MDTSLIPWIFAVIMTIGVTYLVISTVMGGVIDLEIDADLDLDGLDGADANATETRGLSFTTISAFLAGFGSIGLLGSLSGWPLLGSIIAGVLFGAIIGRTVMVVLRYVVRQQSTDLLTTDSLIGSFARITVDTPAGHVGEGLVESDSLIKYPVKAVSDEVELKKGDYVEVIDIQQGRLYVKKKRREDF